MVHLRSRKQHSVGKHLQRRNPKTQKRAHVIVVGKIYANWCGHCQSLIPEWKKLVHVIQTKSKMDRNSNTKYIFSEIEQSYQAKGIDDINRTYLSDSHHKLALQGGFPTLFKIHDGTLHYYNGPRTYLEMLRWYMPSKKSRMPLLRRFSGGTSHRQTRKSGRNRNLPEMRP